MSEPDAPRPDEAESSAPAPSPSGLAPSARYEEPPRSGNPIVLALALAGLLAVGAGVIVVTMNPAVEGDVAATTVAPPVPTGPTVEMKLFIAHDEAAVELPPNVILDVGETVMFELSAAADTTVRVWVEADGVRTADLGTFQAGPEAGLLADGDNLVAYGLGKPGTVVFRASSASSGCDGDSCESVVVQVRIPE